MKSYFDVFMICLVMLSIFFQVYNVENELNETEKFFEQCVVFIFISEYLLRAWLYSDTHRFIITEYEKAEYLNTHFSLFSTLKQIVTKKLGYYSFFVYSNYFVIPTVSRYSPMSSPANVLN